MIPGMTLEQVEQLECVLRIWHKRDWSFWMDGENVIVEVDVWPHRERVITPNGMYRITRT